MEDIVALNLAHKTDGGDKEAGVVIGNLDSGSTEMLARSIQGLREDKRVVDVSLLGHSASHNNSGLVDLTIDHASLGHLKTPLGECTNKISPLLPSYSLKIFKKLARVVNQKKVIPVQAAVGVANG